MKKDHLSRRPAMTAAAAAVIILALAAGTVLATPSSPKAPAAAATVLEYKMPAGRALTYQTKSEDSMVMEVMGQSMDTQSTNTSTFTLKSKGLKDKNLLLGVTIDEIAVSVTSSAQGDLSPDMSSVKGKSFDMVLSPLGSEVDVTGAEAITFTMATESQSIAPRFKTFFPDLPGKPVKTGDTWPSSSDIEQKNSGMNVHVSLQKVNTLEGFETIDGMECARIASEVTGTITGSGNQMGQDMALSGTTKGKDTSYFAVKEGIFVKQVTETTSQLSIDVPSAGMTIPMTQTTKAEVKLTAKK